MDDSKIKVLYITGWGRSGSTILGRLLGQINGFLLGGELRYVWFAWTSNWFCGCGVPLRECTVWRAILNKASEGSDQIDAPEFIRLRKHRGLLRALPLIAVPGGTLLFKPRLETYLADLEKLYRAIQSFTGCKVLVDTTKYPNYGYGLGMIPTIDLYLVHLIRDPHAVAYSWSRKKLLEPNRNVYFPQRKIFQSALTWSVQNIAAEILGGRFPERYLRIRYEDFVAKPAETIQCVLDLLQENALRLPFKTSHSVELGVNHTVAGNPSRFQNGTVDLWLDDEWKEKMKLLDKGVVSAVTWPLLLRYGYL